jgi:hypothetical protein
MFFFDLRSLIILEKDLKDKRLKDKKDTKDKKD